MPNDNAWNVYIDKLAEILNQTRAQWGMKHEWYKYDNQRIAQFPSGCIFCMGSESKWVKFPRIRETILRAQIWYYYERHDKEIQEEKLREYGRGIERKLIANFTLNGWAVMTNVNSAEIKLTPISDRLVVIGVVIEHEAMIRERYDLEP